MPAHQRELARAAWIQAIRRGLGVTPRERLAWLLDKFAYGPPPDPLTDAERGALWARLAVLVSDATAGAWEVQRPEKETIKAYSSRDTDRRGWQELSKADREALSVFATTEGELVIQRSRDRISSGELQAAQRALRQVVEGIIGGRLYVRPLSARLVARLGPRYLPAPPTPRSQFVLSRIFAAPLEEALIEAACALMAEVPPTLLRRCPYQEHQRECSRIFVGVKRQKWCIAHQETAKQLRDRQAQKKHRMKKKGRRKR